FDGLSEQAYYPSFRVPAWARVCARTLMKIMNFATSVGEFLQKPGRRKTPAMSPQGRPKGEFRSAHREGSPMSLRLQINIAITVLMSLFIGTLVVVEIEAARRSVAEEMEASSRGAG